ncbi:MAG: hypothetical protein ABJB55_03315 [Actinomycetota bacterium]
MQKTDLEKRLAFANKLEAPDGWPEVLRRAEGLPQAATRAGRHVLRVASASVVALLFGALVVWAGVVLREDRNHEPVNAPSPVPSPVQMPRDAIVFSDDASRQVTSRRALMAVSADGGPILRLSPFVRNSESGPVWSPDGQRFAFVGNPSKHVILGGNIYVVNADGSGLVQVTEGLRDKQPSWSPDGTHLAFVQDQGTALVVIDVDGNNRRVIARDRGFYQLPTWSPDGNLIAFRSKITVGSEGSAVYTIRPDGTDERQMPIASGGPLVWSPDGSWLAYPGRPNVLWIMREDGSDAHRITTCKLPCVADMDPTWSPDGTQIAFIRQEDGGGATRLYVVDVATGAVRGLTPGLRHVGSPTWRPR